MVVVVTNNVAYRFRGFFASCMLEIAPGVYTAPRMSKGIRERVWQVLSDWYSVAKSGSILMTWQDPGEPGSQGISTLGFPQNKIIEYDDLHLVRREKTGKSSLK